MSFCFLNDLIFSPSLITTVPPKWFWISAYPVISISCLRIKKITCLERKILTWVELGRLESSSKTFGSGIVKLQIYTALYPPFVKKCGLQKKSPQCLPVCTWSIASSTHGIYEKPCKWCKIHAGSSSQNCIKTACFTVGCETHSSRNFIHTRSAIGSPLCRLPNRVPQP